MNQQPAGVAAKAGPVHHVATRVLPVVKIAVLLVSIAAAIPTARNLYYSWLNGVPFAEVPHRLAQYDLWIKNLECKIAYRALLTSNGNKVDVGACAKTGDIAIKITGERGLTAYEWIAFDKLRKPANQTADLFQMLISPAHAGVDEQLRTIAGTSSLRLAQAGMEVLCQARRGHKVVQVIKEGDKCFREIVLPFRGTIEKREEVDCNTRC
jgi:hypothetical protein